MLITTTVTETRTIDIQTPSYFKDQYNFYQVKEHDILVVNDKQITIWKKDQMFFNQKAGDATKGEPITENDFVSAIEEFMENMKLTQA